MPSDPPVVPTPEPAALAEASVEEASVEPGTSDPERPRESTSPENAAPPGIALVVAILVLASSTSIMSTDMYAPSLPDLVAWFDTTPTRVQLTISLNLLAFGLAQLVHGPLSDRFGRRPVMLGSLLAVAALSVACTFAQTIDQMIVLRILLGIAAAAEAVLGLAILKDLYDERQQVKALALLGMVIAVAPAVAPILGGFLHVAFGWQSNFFAIAAMALIACAIVAVYLPESTSPDPRALEPRRVLTGYARLLRNADFVSYSVMLGLSLGLVFGFVTAAPFVLIENLGVPTERFGFYQASIVLAFFLGSVLASRLADHWPGERMLALGVIVIAAGSGALAVVVLGGFLTPVAFAASYSIMTFGMGSVFAVAPSRAMRGVSGQSGTASALLSGIEQIMAGVVAVVVSLLHDETARSLAWLTIALAVALVALLRSTRVRAARAVGP